MSQHGLLIHSKVGGRHRFWNYTKGASRGHDVGWRDIFVRLLLTYNTFDEHYVDTQAKHAVSEYQA